MSSVTAFPALWRWATKGHVGRPAEHAWKSAATPLLSRGAALSTAASASVTVGGPCLVRETGVGRLTDRRFGGALIETSCGEA
jgi:hypothetical protein